MRRQSRSGSSPRISLNQRDSRTVEHRSGLLGKLGATPSSRLESFLGPRDRPRVVPAKQRTKDRRQHPEYGFVRKHLPVEADMRTAGQRRQCPEAPPAQIPVHVRADQPRRLEDRDLRADPKVIRQAALEAARRAEGGEYVFVDEWDVAAPPEAVFDLLADARTYPSWWRPVYLEAESDGSPAPGRESRQHFKGRLPYHLRIRSKITVFEPSRLVGADVDGDLC